MRAITKGPQFMGMHALLLLLHAVVQGSSSMLLHHRARLAARPALAVGLFNRYVGTFNPTLVELKMFNKEKIDRFLKMRTADLPYNREMRQEEEDYVVFQSALLTLHIHASAQPAAFSFPP